MGLVVRRQRLGETEAQVGDRQLAALAKRSDPHPDDGRPVRGQHLPDGVEQRLLLEPAQQVALELLRRGPGRRPGGDVRGAGPRVAHANEARTQLQEPDPREPRELRGDEAPLHFGAP